MKIADALKVKKWSVSELARQVNRSPSYMSRVVRGEMVPHRTLAEEISVALDRLVSPLDILYPEGLS